MHVMRCFAIAPLILAALARIASADEPSDAERLYNEGRALLQAGKPAEARTRFEQSLAKDPRQVGVLMNLGLCDERTGRIASALQLYREALDRAREAHLPGVQAEASAEIDRLTPEVPVLTIVRAAAPAPGEKLVIDDIVIPAGSTALPLDPGRHAVVITAPGTLPFVTTVTLARRQHEELRLPVLQAPDRTAIVAGPSARRPVGRILTLGGAAAVVAAAGLAVYARRDYDALFHGTPPHCGASPDVNGRATCDDIGQPRSEHDHTLGTAAMITGAAGAAIALTGVALWITAPSDTRLSPAVTRSGVGLALTGSF